MSDRLTNFGRSKQEHPNPGSSLLPCLVCLQNAPAPTICSEGELSTTRCVIDHRLLLCRPQRVGYVPAVGKRSALSQLSQGFMTLLLSEGVGSPYFGVIFFYLALTCRTGPGGYVAAIKAAQLGLRVRA